ncbi:hypothetical protein JCM30760_11120 [Thiomicrorhabdus hydrogeniphila]
MNKKIGIYTSIESNRYIPSSEITSILYYELLVHPDGNYAFRITDTKNPQGDGRERITPGTYSKQIFHFDDYKIDEISDSAILLRKAYDMNGNVEQPKYINNTKGFIKPILIDIQKYIDSVKKH